MPSHTLYSVRMLMGCCLVLAICGYCPMPVPRPRPNAGSTSCSQGRYRFSHSGSPLLQLQPSRNPHRLASAEPISFIQYTQLSLALLFAPPPVNEGEGAGA